MITASLSDRPLDVAALVASVGDATCGGIAVFVGTVRADAAAEGGRGRSVVRLDYDAHPSLADEQLRAIAATAAEKWGLVDVVAVHRTGSCDLGEPTVVVACAAPHRAEALDACRYLIDSIKSEVPIWKREVYADGGAWVSSEGG